MTLRYRVNTASREQIYSHLKECDGSFVPPLSSRVDLRDYSDKIFELAVSFEAWQDDVLVGMINAYLNDASRQTGFITNTSILKEYARRGVATTLLQMCLKSALENHFSRIRLEVSRDNGQAIRLYARAGFRIMRENEDYLLMECEIPGISTWVSEDHATEAKLQREESHK